MAPSQLRSHVRLCVVPGNGKDDKRRDTAPLGHHSSQTFAIDYEIRQCSDFPQIKEFIISDFIVWRVES